MSEVPTPLPAAVCPAAVPRSCPAPPVFPRSRASPEDRLGVETRPEGHRWVGHGSLHPEVTLIPELQAQVRGSTSPVFLLTRPPHIQDLTSQSQQLTLPLQHLERQARLCCVPPHLRLSRVCRCGHSCGG